MVPIQLLFQKYIGKRKLIGGLTILNQYETSTQKMSKTRMPKPCNDAHARLVS